MHMGAGVPALNSNSANGRHKDCQERSRLVAQYDATIEAYTESVQAMMAIPGVDSRNAFQRVLEARSACETLRSALVAHEQQHRCANGRAASV
jgi:hypothetical protein